MTRLSQQLSSAVTSRSASPAWQKLPLASLLLLAGQQVVMNLLCLTSYSSVCCETVSNLQQSLQTCCYGRKVYRAGAELSHPEGTACAMTECLKPWTESGRCLLACRLVEAQSSTPQQGLIGRNPKYRVDSALFSVTTADMRGGS